MKRLTGLTVPIKNLEGIAMKDLTGLFVDPTTDKIVPEGTQGAIPQTRDLLPGRVIGGALHQSDGTIEGRPSGFDPLLVDKLARKLYGAGDALDLEDAEYEIVCALFRAGIRPYWLTVPCQQILDGADGEALGPE